MHRFVLGAMATAVIVAPAASVPAAAAAAASTSAVAHSRAVNWPVVRPGARGERVRVIQYLLNQHGVRVGVDGVFGKSTTAGVKAFQRSKRLSADGIVGAATWQKLIVTLRRGSRGDAVRALQHQLRNQYGYRSVSVDGTFGRATEAAVKSFQSKRRLHDDGVVGSATWKALEA